MQIKNEFFLFFSSDADTFLATSPEQIPPNILKMAPVSYTGDTIVRFEIYARHWQ
jgi:hypothetical protein